MENGNANGCNVKIDGEDSFAFVVFVSAHIRGVNGNFRYSTVAKWFLQTYPIFKDFKQNVSFFIIGIYNQKKDRRNPQSHSPDIGFLWTSLFPSVKNLKLSKQ